MVTLAIADQWEWFGSEHGFYRYAPRHLRGAFPGLPDRSQFNRLRRQAQGEIAASFRCLAEALRNLTEPSRLWTARRRQPETPSVGGGMAARTG